MTEVKAFLAGVAGEVEAVVRGALATPKGVTPAEGRLWEAMRYSALAGGKRMRPALVVAAFEACGGGPEDRAEAVKVGAAVELVHTYTLVQDDLPCMDNDDLRRGVPTAHVQYDEATAILASDGLQTAAYALVLGEKQTGDSDGAAVPLEVRAEVLRVLLAAAGAGGVLGGQMIDLVYEWDGVRADEAQLRRLQDLKTGAILQASCVMGGILARAGEAELGALRTYGAALGLAFQIRDDILDVTADAAELGKTPGKDAAAGKATFVTCLGLDKARALVAELVAEGEAALDTFGPRGEMLKELLAFAAFRAA